METPLPAQEQSAPPAQPPQSASQVDTLQDQLFTARLAKASPETISDLEGQLATALGAKPVETQPPVVESNEQQQPVETPAETPELEPPATPPIDDDPEDRIRIKSYPEKDRALVSAAHMLVKSGASDSFEEAFDRVRGIQRQAPKEQAPPTPTVPPIIAELEQEVTRLEAELDTAGANEGVFDKNVSELTKQLSRANARLEAKRESHLNQTSVKGEVDDAMFEQQREGVLSATARDYPQMRDKTSEQWALAKDLATAAANDKTHPDYKHVVGLEAPRYFAEKAARFLGIKTATAAPSTPSQPPASPASSGPPKPGPAPGSRQTAPQPTYTTQDVSKAADDLVAGVLNGTKQVPKNAPQRAIFIGR